LNSGIGRLTEVSLMFTITYSLLGVYYYKSSQISAFVMLFYYEPATWFLFFSIFHSHIYYKWY